MAGNLALIAVSRKIASVLQDTIPNPATNGIAEAIDALKVPDNPMQAFINLQLDAEPVLGPFARNPSPPSAHLQPIHQRLKETFDSHSKFPALHD